MAEFERIKAHLIRSLFHDPPDLTTIQEENESLTAASPPLSPESYRSYSPCPPPAHSDGLWSPLPPLTIEIVKNTNKYDDSEEFYKRLQRKILKIYRRIFFEDRSDIGDINTSDDDDTPTAPNDYSANNVELVELTHKSINDISGDDDRSNNNEPIDYSISHVELVESTSVNNIAAHQENQEIVATAGSDYQQTNEKMESPDNEPPDDESHNERNDDSNYSNEDGNHYQPNLETIFESDEDNLSNSHANENNSANLEANIETDKDELFYLEPDGSKTPNSECNIENDEGHVSSSTDVMANSTESDRNRDSVTPLSSTVILSPGTSDEELCLERNDVPANTTHQIAPDTKEIEGIPSPRPSTGAIPKVAVSTNVPYHIGFESAKIQESEPLEPRPSTGPTAEAISNERNMDIVKATEADKEDTETPEFHEETQELPEGTPQLHEETPEPHERTTALHEETPEAHKGTPSKYTEDNASMDIDSDNNPSEVEEMRTPRPHHSTGSPAHHHKNIQPNEPNIIIVKHHASIPSDIYSDKEEEMPTTPNINIENTNNLDIFDLIRISSPKGIIDVNKKIINPEEYAANISSEDHSGDMPSEDHSERNSPEDRLKRNSPDDHLERNSPEYHSRMDSPENHSRMNSPENHSRMNSPENHSRMNSPENHSRMNSPEDHSEINSPENHLEKNSPENHSKMNSPEDHSERNSPEGNSRKRISVTPCHCGGKKVKLTDKYVQTDDFNRNELIQNIDININPVDKMFLINHINRNIIQNIKININTLLSV